jgi:hypothetical protein
VTDYNLRKTGKTSAVQGVTSAWPHTVLHSVSFIVSLSKAALPHRKLATIGTSLDGYLGQGHNKAGSLYNVAKKQIGQRMREKPTVRCDLHLK